ncbi:hypothetical protein OpiT1DRAFT_01275 [Opitutaceae bacterium TAV1]|nr:hypothetical protein OpiT1DRAFT_01275 [Opitutaceae bacterium TAV1]
MEHFNKLTPSEAERLALLAEECAETIQVVGKIPRHGYESRHPDGGPTNRGLLEKESGDVCAALVLLKDSGDLSRGKIHDRMEHKLDTVGRFLHHA